MYSDLGTPLASPVIVPSSLSPRDPPSRPPSSLASTASSRAPELSFFGAGYPTKLKGVQSPPKISPESLPLLHPKYFLEGDVNSMAMLLVEGHLFRIHRYFLERDSVFFQGLLAANSGQSDPSQAIEIRNVTCQQFQSLLDFFYDGMYRLAPDAVSISEWVDLLAVTTTLHFEKARSHAIAAIDASIKSLDPVEMIVLAQKYDIRKWLRPAYTSLCLRTEPLLLSEAAKVGLPVFVKLSQAREELLREESLREEINDHQERKPGSPHSVWGESRSLTPVKSNLGVDMIVNRIFFASGGNPRVAKKKAWHLGKAGGKPAKAETGPPN